MYVFANQLEQHWSHVTNSGFEHHKRSCNPNSTKTGSSPTGAPVGGKQAPCTGHWAVLSLHMCTMGIGTSTVARSIIAPYVWYIANCSQMSMPNHGKNVQTNFNCLSKPWLLKCVYNTVVFFKTFLNFLIIIVSRALQWFAVIGLGWSCCVWCYLGNVWLNVLSMVLCGSVMNCVCAALCVFVLIFQSFTCCCAIAQLLSLSFEKVKDFS